MRNHLPQSEENPEIPHAAPRPAEHGVSQLLLRAGPAPSARGSEGTGGAAPAPSPSGQRGRQRREGRQRAGYKHGRGTGRENRGPRPRTRVTVTRVTGNRPVDPGGLGQPLPPTAAPSTAPARPHGAGGTAQRASRGPAAFTGNDEPGETSGSSRGWTARPGPGRDTNR